MREPSFPLLCPMTGHEVMGTKQKKKKNYLNMRTREGIFLIVEVAKHRKSQCREVVVFPSLEIFNSCLDTDLGNRL